MSFLKSIFAGKSDPRDAVRPLWTRIIEISREREWYGTHGVEDSVSGRFDMISAVLSIVLVRLEREGRFGQEIASLTELFVEDMDGQLRELGINDVVVGKHMGRLMATLGGRIGAFRDGLNAPGNRDLTEAVERNIQLVDEAGAEGTATALAKLFAQLEAIDGEKIVVGEIVR